MLIKVSRIKYDIEPDDIGSSGKPKLPRKLTFEVDDVFDADEVADLVTNRTGFLVKTLNFRVLW